MTKALKMKVVQTNEDKAREYKHIKAEIDKLEKAAKDINSELSDIARSNGGELQAGPFLIRVTECQRENFNAKEAKAVLGFEVVSPFISHSQYDRLTVTLTEES